MAVGNTRQESAMLKFSQTQRRSILTLVAVAALGNVMVTDASARGFGGGGFGGGRSFGGISHGFGGGGQLGGLRQASLPATIHAPVGGIHVPPGAGLQPIHSGGTIQPPAGGFHVPARTGLQPVHSGTGTIQPPPGGIHVPPGFSQLPNAPGTGTIQPPPGGIHVPPGFGQLPNAPGTGTIQPPPGLHVLPPPLPHLNPAEPPRPIDPTPPVNTANPTPPPYPAAPGIGEGDAGGSEQPSVGGSLVAALVGDATSAALPAPVVTSDTMAIQVAAPSYTRVSGPTCDRFLRNGCYLAMRKYSTPDGGAELRCTMICE
jgi:hypothetical protein